MERIGKTAIVFGPTGAVGKEILQLLLHDHRYDKVIAFSRKILPDEHPKLEVVLDSLLDIYQLADKIKGDEVFCCLGTTSRKAGSRAAFKKVDLDLPVAIASIASKNKVDGFIVISSIGAGKKGKGFYLNVKTEMEDLIVENHFKRLSIIRPSLLLAKREEFRPSEEFGKLLNTILGWTMKGNLKKYKGIEAPQVARAMIEIMNMNDPQLIWESDELQNL